MAKNYDDIRYTVRRVDDRGHYEITKWGDRPEPYDSYDVTIPPSGSTVGVWCGCMGFRRQTYAKELHKHIVLVREHIAQGEPEGRVYALDGVADACSVRVVNTNIFADIPLPTGDKT